MDVFHIVQRLEEDLRHCRYNFPEEVEVHLRKMRNKQLGLADLRQYGIIHNDDDIRAPKLTGND